MQRTCFATWACLSIFTTVLLVGCQGSSSDDKANRDKAAKMAHSHADELKWSKEGIEHEGFVISLGHHRDHFHGGEPLEPAVAISKDDKDVGDASLTCQLMDGETAIGEPVAMVFEPKTKDEPAHYAQGMLKFPKEEKTYQIHFAITLPGTETAWEDSIDVDVKSGH